MADGNVKPKRVRKPLTPEQKAKAACYARQRRHIIKNHGLEAWKRLISNKAKAKKIRKQAQKTAKSAAPASKPPSPKIPATKTITKAVKAVKAVKKAPRVNFAARMKQLEKGGNPPSAAEIQHMVKFTKSGKPRTRRLYPHSCDAAIAFYGENPKKGADGKWYYTKKDANGKEHKVYCE